LKQTVEASNPAVGPIAETDLLGPGSWSFQHFLDGPALRIAQNLDKYKDYNTTLVLSIREHVSSYDNPLVRKMVQKAGFSEEKIQPYCGGWNTAEPCVSGPQHVDISMGCSNPPFDPTLAGKFRSLMGVHDATPSSGAKLVLSSRNGVGAGVNNRGRTVKNEPAVEELCKKLAKRYNLVYEKLTKPIKDSVEEVVDYFGKVKLLVGPHGGALYNTWFMPKDAALIELSGGGESYFWGRAARLGLQYGVLYNEGFGWNNKDMTVDIADLEKLMVKVLKASGLDD